MLPKTSIFVSMRRFYYIKVYSHPKLEFSEIFIGTQENF